MSKKTNKTLIGAFVVGAIALVVAGVLIFGSGKFLRKTIFQRTITNCHYSTYDRTVVI